MSNVDWAKIKDKVPATCKEFTDLIAEHHSKGGDAPARAVDKALREQIAKIKKRFEEAKGGAE